MDRACCRPIEESFPSLSAGWTHALDEAAESLSAGQVVVAAGESGCGRATLLRQALRRSHHGDRILSASPPAARDVEAWLQLWPSELRRPRTGVVLNDVDTLTTATALRLRGIIERAHLARGANRRASLAFTVQDARDVPAALAPLIDRVVQVPALRERPDDVLPLASHAARLARGRDILFTPATQRALRDAAWPGNVDQLFNVVRAAIRRTDTVDVQHLPPEVLSRPGHRLTRIEIVERDEIVRAMTRPGATVNVAALELGMSRATIYRKLRQYRVRLPGRTTRRSS